MGGTTPKQFLALGGLPIIVHTLRVLQDAEAVTEIILAVPAADREYCLHDIVTCHGFTKVTQIVAGGEHRQDSVRHGLAEVGASIEVVLVHDAVRPFLTVQMVQNVIDRAAKHGAAIVAVPMRDTVKRADPHGMIHDTLSREHLWLAHTPQAFRRALFCEAHRRAEADGFHGTDDAQLVERLGHRVETVDSSWENIKITRPEDLAIGEAILASRVKRDR
jgi:2-C-methyl-D-erythritol 4-phosphate cytidylyltransferase